MANTCKKILAIALTLCIAGSIIASGIGLRYKPIAMPETKGGTYGKWVNPFIGTGGSVPWASAMLFPGPTAPFGMVRLSPDTSAIRGFEIIQAGNAGYYYNQGYIIGFSHTRLSGTGARSLGHFRVTPAAGNADPAKRFSKPLLFSHDEEVATAGYYAVNLPEAGCLAELTATPHAGVHRYTFSTKQDAHLWLDATSFLGKGNATEGKIKVLPEQREIQGEGRIHNSFTGGSGGSKAYFIARFNKPVTAYSTWNEEGNIPGRAEAAGNDTGADLNFGDAAGQPIELQLGMSYISLDNARKNLETEVGQKDFEAVRGDTRTSWDDWLSRIQIETPDEEIKTIFYTALYHSMIMPTNYTDVNGQYLGFQNKIGTAVDYTYRTDMSIWDTFRTEHPLLLMIAPEIQRDCLISLVEMAKTGGSLPRWPAGAGYTGSMIGTPTDMVIAESYLKGLRDFDYETAYSYMKKSSNEEIPDGADGRKDVTNYNALGYVPADVTDKSVSRTLEYAWADGSIALMAQAMGKTDDAETYTKKSMNYKNLFNPETKYFQGRNADGSWVEPLKPKVTSYSDEIRLKKVAKAYCEGSARQWRWVAPLDTQGLLTLFGSKEYFVSELEEFMADASKDIAAVYPGSGFWLGNQHDMHAPYLFNDAGRADLTQKWVRWALSNRHSTAANGLDGNDDGGTMSSWFVFSSMGLYPVAGSDRYWLGSPCLDKAELKIDGHSLVITAENQSTENIYVQSVTLNGIKLDAPFLTHEQIANGGTLHFVMGEKAATNGGY